MVCTTESSSGNFWILVDKKGAALVVIRWSCCLAVLQDTKRATSDSLANYSLGKVVADALIFRDSVGCPSKHSVERPPIAWQRCSIHASWLAYYTDTLFVEKNFRLLLIDNDLRENSISSLTNTNTERGLQLLQSATLQCHFNRRLWRLKNASRYTTLSRIP